MQAGRKHEKNDLLVHTRLEVKQYLVKANLLCGRGVASLLPACRSVRTLHVENYSRISRRSHKKTNTVVRLVNPVYDMDMYLFKVTVFMKQAKYE